VLWERPGWVARDIVDFINQQNQGLGVVVTTA
jgi:hypothetical protein